MCQNASAMKSVRNTKSTKHTLTFLKSNYKYKRRYRTSMRNANAKGVEQLKRTALAGEQAQEVKLAMAEESCINAKNTLKNAINQIISTNRIKCEIKLIFKLFILFVGNLLTHTTCHTNDRSQSCRVPLMHYSSYVDDDDGIVVGGDGGGGDGGDASFDDTSHQQRNYDKVSSKRCQKAMLHQWRQRRRRQQQQMSAYNGQTRRAKRQREQKHQQQQQQQQQQAIYISRRIVGNQNRRSFFSRRGNDSNWQDLSPVVARLSTKTPATTTITTTTTTTKTISQLQHTSPTTAIANNSSGSSSNGRINMLSTLAAILFMALAFNATPPVDAGACWRSSQSNGKCSEIYLRNSTKTECCRYPELFYTDRDVTDVEFFFSTTVGDGMTCSPCALSCKSMQCGWNKKCVKRKGRPKCVCAPECGGAAKRHKQRAQPKLYRGHEPHSEQLRMNRHIVLGSEFFSSGFAVSGVGGGDRMVAGDRKVVADTLFAEGKSPRDIRSLSSEITNINLGVEHQKQIQQIQNQNQRNKMINIMQSQQQQQQQQQQQRQQSQQKPQLMNIRRVEKPGRLLITANIEHGTEKPVQRRLQIFSNVRTHSRKHHKNNNFKRDNFDDDEFHNGDHDDNDDDDDGDDDESMDDANEEDRTFVADNDDDVAHEEDNDDDDDGDIDDWLDDSGVGDASTGNHRRSSDDSAKRTPSPLESRRGLSLPSRHKTNKNSNHKKRRQHENEMELIKRHQENSNNNNFAIIRRFQAAAPAPASSSPSLTSNSRRLDTTAIATTNHGEVLRPAGDTLNVNGPSNNNNGSRGKGKNNLDNGGRQRERHHHQQRKRKHQKQQQQQQQHQQQHQQTNGQQHNQRVHKKHKKLKDHNGNNSDNNNNNNNLRTRTSSATATLEAALTTTAATATTTIVVPTTTFDWQTTDATTPVNSMSPSSDDRRLLNHGSHIAKSSSSSYSTSSSTASLGGAIKKHKIGTSSPSVAFFGGEGVSADVSKSSLNSDDSTLLEGIYDDFNIYGFPNHQFEVAVENFHGPHPVCGTDGRTYNTECQLKKRACRTNNPTLSVAYRGHCRTSCNGVKCLNGHTCVEDQYTIPHCIACKIDCPEDDAAAMASMPIDPTRAVCGVDGKTYRSVCDINRMICKSGRSIAVAYPGPCREIEPWSFVWL
ncbi:putative uncharacterized protein DDB_G0277255 isoform X2 [Ceratitis capitata]|uniref:putative uncharacterized protein DDB_G0277255 isoform X2 n=1 Tax=Ceratitis capitata TaxID=7213 RepID=UPI000A10A83E|nr:putative uncharacterized protein DDB_G0277255 isoform X2 [Ceratitis capitata]